MALCVVDVFADIVAVVAAAMTVAAVVVQS